MPRLVFGGDLTCAGKFAPLEPDFSSFEFPWPWDWLLSRSIQSECGGSFPLPPVYDSDSCSPLSLTCNCSHSQTHLRDCSSLVKLFKISSTPLIMSRRLIAEALLILNCCFFEQEKRREYCHMQELISILKMTSFLNFELCCHGNMKGTYTTL